MTTRFTLAALAAAVLAACSATPGPRPALELPQAEAAAPASVERWWTQFNDPQLNALVDEALANNLDLKIAVARIDEARAGLRLARSEFFPSLDANFSSNRSQRSQATDLRQGPPFTSTTHNLGLSTAYEIDVFGRVRAGASAASRSLDAQRFDAIAVRTSLAAQVAATYFSLRTFDADLALTKATLVTRDENVRLQRRRADVGESSQYDLAQAEAERAVVAASVPQLEKAVAQTESALASLLGRGPRAVFAPVVARGNELEKFGASAPEVPAGLTSDLLARRPDVRRAEANLDASDARVAEARAQYYPRLTLTASYGGESAELSDLLKSPARVWSIAGGLVQPIIGLNRIGAQVDAATARRTQASLAYQQTVQAAFRDTHDALIAHRGARASFVAQDERRNKLADALRLAELRYKNGYSSYLEVLDAQRGLLAAERDRITALRDRQTAVVDLYKALGGGWSIQEAMASKQ